MRKPPLRVIARTLIAWAVVLGAVGLVLDQVRVTLAAVLLLAAYGALQSTRTGERVRVAEQKVLALGPRVERVGQKLEKVRGRLEANERETRRISRQVRVSRERTVASFHSVEVMQRRYLAVIERERLRAFDRHQEVLDIVPRELPKQVADPRESA